MEALKKYNWDCFVFQDVDLYPEDYRLTIHPIFYQRSRMIFLTFDLLIPSCMIMKNVQACNNCFIYDDLKLNT